MRAFLALLGIVLVAPAFLPLTLLFGPFPDERAVPAPFDTLLAALTLPLLALVLARIVPEAPVRMTRPIAARIGQAGSWRVIIAASFVVLVLELAIGWFVFRFRPLHLDSVIQYFQGLIFASGSLTAPAPTHPEFFVTPHMLFDGGRWYSQYPPGHALLLAIGIRMGVPWLVGPLLSCGTVVALGSAVRDLVGEEAAKRTVLLMCLCPFFLFMGGGYMNHVSTLFFLSLALAGYARWDREGMQAWAAVCGACVGGAFLIRPLCAVSAGLVLGGFMLVPGHGRWRIRGVMLFGAVGLAVASITLAYNASTTGDALLFGYEKLWGAAHRLGFHATPWGEDFTPWRALGNTLFNLAALNRFLFEWRFPGLAIISLALLSGWRPTRAEALLICWFAAPFIAYFFYWHRDSFLGPRFAHMAIAAAVPLTICAYSYLEGTFGDAGLRLPGGEFRLRGAAILRWGVSLCLLSALFLSIPQRLEQYASSFSSMKVDIVSLARAQGIERGLIFVPVAWGNRLINRLRAIGVPAPLTEIAYRTVDHCLLSQEIDRWDSGETSDLMSLIESLVARAEPIQRFNLNGDRTLRLLPSRSLTTKCREEIGYDVRGYTIYLPHLLGNAPKIGAPFVVATDLREKNHMIMAEFPDLQPFILRDGHVVPMDGNSSR